MQTVIVKRSIVIAGHKTSVSLEDAFWNSLKDIGRSSDQTAVRMRTAAWLHTRGREMAARRTVPAKRFVLAADENPCRSCIAPR